MSDVYQHDHGCIKNPVIMKIILIKKKNVDYNYNKSKNINNDNIKDNIIFSSNIIAINYHQIFLSFIFFL